MHTQRKQLFDFAFKRNVLFSEVCTMNMFFVIMQEEQLLLQITVQFSFKKQLLEKTGQFPYLVKKTFRTQTVQ